MRLNRLGQGLTVSAVSALFITGLAVTSTAVAAAGDGARLLSQQNGLASVKRDADDPSGTSITLTAQRLDPTATITFQYNPDPAAADGDADWADVGGEKTYGDYVTAEWYPEDALIGTRVAIRSVATSASATTYSTRPDVLVSGPSSPTHAVAIGVIPFYLTTDRSASYFSQPYADSRRTATLTAITGTTSATGGTVALSAWNPQAGAFQGTVDAAVEPDDLKVTSGGPDGNTYIEGGRFTGVLDIQDFDLGSNLVVRAERDTDSVVPYPLRAQTISQIYPTEKVRPNDTVLTMTVSDAQGFAVVGAEVRRSSDGSLVDYTGADGTVQVTVPNETTTDGFYVNTTDADQFEPGTDYETGELTTSPYVPIAAGTTAVLADGSVFDDREYAEGDIALQVVDEYGQPYADTEMVEYALYPSGTPRPDWTTVTTDATGRAVVPFDPSGPDGAWTLAMRAPSSTDGHEEPPVEFVAGDAVLGLTPGTGTAASGGDIAYTGSLTVEGRPLTGRTVSVAYTRGSEQAPGTEADAAMVIAGARTLSGTATTGADGRFTVTVDDLPEVGNPAESGGSLRASALGDSVASTADFTAGPVTPATPQQVKGTLKLTGSSVKRQKDKLKVVGPRAAAGARVTIMAKGAGGKFRKVKVVTLDRTGVAKLTVRDRNGRTVTRYYARMKATTAVTAARSKVLRIR